MTITYTGEVATSKYAIFLRLLLRWKGSIYKVVWPDFVVFSLLYAALSVIYRTALTESQRRVFELIALYCDQYSSFIPLSFVLGFYVSVLMTRWWDQFTSIPWPDKIAILVSNAIKGQDERGRLMRRSIMRYVNLTYVLTFVLVSPRVKKRFPTMDHIVETGLMVPEEKEIIEKLTEKTKLVTNFVPIVWASTIVTRAYKEKRISDAFVMQTIINSLNDFRGGCGTILNYDWITMPLMYTQVVTLAVYSFFLASTMGRQWLDPKQGYPGQKIDLYVPIFTLLQFFFYMGWLKVGETLINPFGEDGDDFEMNYMVDRNIQYGYVVVDEMHEDHPELIRDQYWDEIYPEEFPYTLAAEKFKRDHPPMGSTAGLKVPAAETEYSNLMSISYGHHRPADIEDIYETMDSPLSIKSNRRKRNFSVNSSFGKTQSSETTRGVISNFFRRSLRVNGNDYHVTRSVKSRPRHPSPKLEKAAHRSLPRTGRRRSKTECEDDTYSALDEATLEEIMKKISEDMYKGPNQGPTGKFKSESQKSKLNHLYKYILTNLHKYNKHGSREQDNGDCSTRNTCGVGDLDLFKAGRKISTVSSPGETNLEKRKFSDISEKAENYSDLPNPDLESQTSLENCKPDLMSKTSVDSGIFTKYDSNKDINEDEADIKCNTKPTDPI